MERERRGGARGREREEGRNERKGEKGRRVKKKWHNIKLLPQTEGT